MRRTLDGRILYSPSDLITFWNSPFASWMDRFVLEHPDKARPEPPTEEDQVLFDQGLAHEKAYLEAIQKTGRGVSEIPDSKDQREALTRKAMEEGRDIIYQAALSGGDFAGFADFLEKTPGKSKLGEYHYIPIDTKLGANPKPRYLIQLSAYAEMLEGIQGLLPETISVILRGMERRDFRTEDVLFYARAVKKSFLAFMRGFDASHPPVPESGAEHGGWSSLAEAKLKELDHLSAVAGITRSQTKKLQLAGIDTFSKLATTQAPRVPRLSDSTFIRLKDQAALQKASEGKEKPEVRMIPPDPDAPRKGLALLPPPSAEDVYFDMEGYPHVEGGLEYLFGAVHLMQGKPEFRDWWAHDRSEEKRAFEGFIDWIYELWKRDSEMHVYHYSAYEVSALRRLMGRHATREEVVDALLRAEVFVDLYAVVRGGIRLGTPSYSIKDVESLYREKRQGEVKGAGASIVKYHRWRESGESGDPTASSLLSAIRDYNKEDCDSTWRLCSWLRERQKENGIVWLPKRDKRNEETEEKAAGKSEAALAIVALEGRLLAAIPADPESRAREAERWRVQELVTQLLEFHRREAKPVWWAMFDRHAMTEDELVEDLDCLGALDRDGSPPVDIKKSKGFGYIFDPDQDTKLDEESACYFAHDLEIKAEIHTMDRQGGKLCIKFGPKAIAQLPRGIPPKRLSLIPDEFVSAKTIADSIRHVAERLEGGELSPALEDFLYRRPPRIKGHKGGSLVREGESASAAALRIIPILENSCLTIQGPPGAGKTWTAAHAILALLKSGKRVGITANSHKAILNLMRTCAKEAGGKLPCVKLKGEKEDSFYKECIGARYADGVKEVTSADRLVGGTAWDFSSELFRQGFDVLFVDEAGQMSVANLVGMSPSAKNLVLMGDQMQLSQPMKGAHPGESGLSCLDYFMQGLATVPSDRGLFLETTWRLHPKLCRFVSGAIYEGRLKSEVHTEQRRVLLPTGGGADIPLEAGILFVPVQHEGNTQCSDEEAEIIHKLVKSLIGRSYTDDKGAKAGVLKLENILLVAPYNMQVRRLQGQIGKETRVGSVDRFQGQEAPVVILSMCASSAEGSPRGLEFLMNRNRLNVAVSRAQSLAIVVASPALAGEHCSTIEDLKRVNIFSRIIEESEASLEHRALP